LYNTRSVIHLFHQLLATRNMKHKQIGRRKIENENIGEI
jgi:hypothetical protein